MIYQVLCEEVTEGVDEREKGGYVQRLVVEV
jgi:hypothetical protein